MCMHDWFQATMCSFFMGLLLEFQSCKCSLSLLISMALLFWANMSTNYVRVQYKGRCLMPHMETIWAQMDISSYVFYCYHTASNVKDGLNKSHGRLDT